MTIEKTVVALAVHYAHSYGIADNRRERTSTDHYAHWFEQGLPLIHAREFHILYTLLKHDRIPDSLAAHYRQKR